VREAIDVGRAQPRGVVEEGEILVIGTLKDDRNRRRFGQVARLSEHRVEVHRHLGREVVRLEAESLLEAEECEIVPVSLSVANVFGRPELQESARGYRGRDEDRPW